MTDMYTATELAYKRGYADGKRDAEERAKTEREKTPSELQRENRQFRAAFDKAVTESAYFKAAFEQANAANDDLFAKLTAMKAERDAAIEDIEMLIHDHCIMDVCELCDLNPRSAARCKEPCSQAHWRGAQND